VKRLKEDPKLANALPLTTAIVREIMRVYPPATSVRVGPPGATVTGRDGKSYPTEGFMVWVNNNTTMHDPSIFPHPYEFIPNRFLPEKSPFPPIPKNTYRPFEKGPRDCIGQELAMLEMRVVLALILRKFDFKEAYGELDRRLGRKVKVFEECEKIGGRAYQILWTIAKPKDGLPMWVKETK
jgi:cytochrome P450